MEAAWFVGRYGAQAVFGGLIPVGDMRRMSIAKQIFDAYHGRKQAKDWVEWAKAYPEASRLLNEIATQGEVTNGK